MLWCTCLTCFTCTSHPVHCTPVLTLALFGFQNERKALVRFQNERKSSKGNAHFFFFHLGLVTWNKLPYSVTPPPPPPPPKEKKRKNPSKTEKGAELEGISPAGCHPWQCFAHQNHKIHLIATSESSFISTVDIKPKGNIYIWYKILGFYFELFCVLD